MTLPRCSVCGWPADWHLTDDDRPDAADEARDVREPMITRTDDRCHAHVFDAQGFTAAIRLFDAPDAFAGFAIRPKDLRDTRAMMDAAFAQRKQSPTQ